MQAPASRHPRLGTRSTVRGARPTLWCGVAIVVRIYEGVSWLCVSWLLVSLFFRREASERTQHFVVHARLG